MELKPVVFLGRSKRTIKKFPEEARKNAGAEIKLLQLGQLPTDWKSMKGIGLGAREIRIHHPHEHRVIFVASYPEAIYILHAFEKKSEKTNPLHIQVARQNYAKISQIHKTQE